jgi:putative glycosyltransferase (TIGR04372 family)
LSKTLYRLNIILNGIWVLPTLVIINIYSKFKKIQFRAIYSNKIGHFILDGAEEFNFYKMNSNTKVFFYFSNPRTISNTQWAKMLKRNIPIHSFIAHKIGKWLEVFPSLRHLHSKGTSVTANRNSRFLKQKNFRNDLKLEFTASENQKGVNWLRSIGWKDGEMFVCLLVRDNTYVETNLHTVYSKDAIYLNEYRNSKFASYELSIAWLVNQKRIWVFRMGHGNEKKSSLNSEKFFDYANSGQQSDFLDIWLFANSSGIISSSSGPDALACIYQVPLLLVDMLPLNGTFTFSDCLTVPKKLTYHQNNKPLSLTETLNSSWSLNHKFGIHLNANSTDYVKRGIDIIDLSPEEILLATMEFWGRVEGNYVSSEEDNFLQDKFWQIFKAHPDYNFNHGWKHPNSRIGRDWLKSMGEDFLR